MKRALILFLVFCLSFSFTFQTKISAENNSNVKEKLNINVETTTNSVKLSWNDLADHYEVISMKKNEKKIWSGKATSFVNSNLESDHLYKYKIVAYDSNNNKLDKVVVKTSTLKTNVQIEKTLKSNKEMLNKNNKKNIEASTIYYPMVDSHIDTIVRDNEVKLVWYNLPDEDQQYEIYRNGKYLTTVRGNEYLDTSLPKADAYKYSIIGYKKIPQNKIKEKQSFLKQKNIQVNKENEQALFYERKELGTIVKVSEDNVTPRKLNDKVKTLMLPEYPDGYGYLVRYTTFIPLDRAPNPWCESAGFCTYDEFEGDTNERGFDMWSDKFRTRADAYVTWDWDTNQPNPITFDPQTGVTIGYKNGVEVDRAQAPANEDMKIQSEETGSDWIYHRMFLASKNPLVTAPDIDAFYYAKLYNSSYSAEFYGVHDQAPSHELYLMDYPGDMGFAIHQHEHQGFDYLFPWTTKTEFNVSFIYT